MKTKTTKGTKRAPAASSAAPGAGVYIATVARWDDDGAFVTLPRDDRGPVAARVMCPVGSSRRDARAAVGQSVVVMLDATGAPVILGEMHPVGALEGAVARVDGRRVEIVAADEIELKCGEASLVLRRNGRVVLRGVQVETRATGLNRIKGGTVAIN